MEYAANTLQIAYIGIAHSGTKKLDCREEASRRGCGLHLYVTTSPTYPQNELTFNPDDYGKKERITTRMR